MLKETMLIENELYDKIREVLPTVCVDLLVTNEEGKYLLAKRTEKPAQGWWWFPGGRIHKGETWTECARRKGKEELGVDLPIGNIISVEDYFASDADWHTVNLVVHAFFSHRLIELDDTHEEFRWVERIEKDLHKCVTNPLSIYGFK